MSKKQKKQELKDRKERAAHLRAIKKHLDALGGK